MDEQGRNRNRKKWYFLDRRSVSFLLVLILAITFYVCLTHINTIRDGWNVFIRVIQPFIVGFAIAYLLNVPVTFFDEKVFYKLRRRRGLAILTVYLIAFAVLAVLLILVIPQVIQSVVDLAGNLEYYLDRLNELIQAHLNRFSDSGDQISNAIGTYHDLMQRITSAISKALPEIFSSVVAVGQGLIAAITALVSSIYMLAGKKRLVRQLKKLSYAVLPTQKSDRLLQICSRANSIFVGFISGKLLDSAIIGALCFAMCMILRIPYAVLVAVIVGITNIIPFFGPIIGALPCVAILVLVDPWAALRFFILVIALQQFDGNILGPKILGDSTGLSAIWVLIAIVVGGGLFGFPGMVLGVPTFAVLYTLVREWVNDRLRYKQIDGNGKPRKG